MRRGRPGQGWWEGAQGEGAGGTCLLGGRGREGCTGAARPEEGGQLCLSSGPAEVGGTGGTRGTWTGRASLWRPRCSEQVWQERNVSDHLCYPRIKSRGRHCRKRGEKAGKDRAQAAGGGLRDHPTRGVNGAADVEGSQRACPIRRLRDYQPLLERISKARVL